MSSSWSLKNCFKTLRKMDSSRSLPSMPGTHLWLLLLLSMELQKQNQDTTTAMETQWTFVTEYWNLVPGKQQQEPNFLFQTEYVYLAFLPPFKSHSCSVQWPQKSLLGEAFQYVPIRPNWFSKLKESFAFSCALSNFHFGSPPFQQQKRPTIHYTSKFLLIFCLDTL